MTATPHDRDSARAEGDRLRNAGMTLAAQGRDWLILRGQLALLDAIRSAPDRTATTDDATSDLMRAYPDGGRWRGSIPRALSHLGLIRKAGAVSSARASRHGGLVAAWQGIDDAAIDRHRAELRRRLAKMTPPVAAPEQQNLFE